jgi:hypothetical protein
VPFFISFPTTTNNSVLHCPTTNNSVLHCQRSALFIGVPTTTTCMSIPVFFHCLTQVKNITNPKKNLTNFTVACLSAASSTYSMQLFLLYIFNFTEKSWFCRMRNNEADISIHPVNVRCRQRHINQAILIVEKRERNFSIQDIGRSIQYTCHTTPQPFELSPYPSAIHPRFQNFKVTY